MKRNANPSSIKKEKPFKIFFGDSEIRRVKLSIVSWESFTEQLYIIYNDKESNLFHLEKRIHYVDEEGDKCIVTSEHEFEAMIQLFNDVPIIKLYINEGPLQGQYFKDGVPPEEVCFYLKEGEKETRLVEGDKDVKNEIIKSLEELFDCKKILPYNLPPWTCPYIKLRSSTSNDAEVDLDIDVLALTRELHNQAIKIMTNSPNELNRAKSFLKVCLAINPKDSIAHYNMACAESLLNNSKTAIESLSKAVENGYENLDHLRQDPDLDNIRNLAEYKAVETLLNDKLKPKTPMPTLYKAVETLSNDESKPKAPMPTRYSKELTTLLHMGFDYALAVEKLQKTKGDLNIAVNELLTCI